MRNITQFEWNKIHKDYKSISDDGIKHMLINENGATVLVPVNIIN